MFSISGQYDFLISESWLVVLHLIPPFLKSFSKHWPTLGELSQTSLKEFLQLLSKSSISFIEMIDNVDEFTNVLVRLFFLRGKGLVCLIHSCVLSI